MAHEIDPEYARTKDLSKPLIAVESPFEVRDGYCVLLIIDGWHRITKAVLENYPHPLKVHVLNRAEEMQCRIERITGA
jgi:hypothetical protein